MRKCLDMPAYDAFMSLVFSDRRLDCWNVGETWYMLRLNNWLLREVHSKMKGILLTGHGL